MKRLTAVLVCVAILMTAIPVPTLASEEKVEYTRSVPVYPVMNAQTYNRSSFLSQYVGSDNNSVYNIAPAFRKQSSSAGASSMPTNLTFGTSFTHKNDSNTYAMYYEYDFEDAMTPALKKGDLHLSYVANLTNDRHWNIDRHLSTWTAYPVTWLRTYQDTELIVHTTEDYSRDGTWTMGKNQFVPIPAKQYQEKLWFRAFAQVCTCGSSKVSNMSIMLADVVGPAVKSITTSGVRNGVLVERLTSFGSGDTVRIHLEFDEQIRFAGDTAMSLSAAPKLKLELKRVSDNMIETGFSAEATLTSLKNDALTFEYTVPADIPIEHYISSIAPYLNQDTWVSSTDAFDIKLFNTKTGSQPTYINYTYKTTSLIVDLAGNPIDIARSVRTLNRSVQIDSTAPVVTKIDVFREFAALPQAELTRRDVYVGESDFIGFDVDFSEHLYFIRLSDNHKISLSSANLHEYELLAELNLTRDGSTPLLARASYVAAQWDSKKSFDRIHFSMNSNLEGVKPLVFAGQALPIGINRIYLNNEAYKLADTVGNVYNSSRKFMNVPSGRIMPERELWLDVVAPSITTTLATDGATYEPLKYEPGDLNSFYIPILISDKNTIGEDYMSLTNGCTALFSWLPLYGGGNDYSFEYAVTGSASRPANSQYKQSSMGQSIAFPQLDGGNYLHIRLLSGAEFRAVGSQIRIIAFDNAGNQASGFFPIEFNLDRIAPRIIQGQTSKKFQAGVGKLTTEILVEDHSEALVIEHQWTDLKISPTGVWAQVSAYTTFGEELKYHSFSLERTVAPDTHYTGSLHIRVTDEGNNTAITRFDYEYHLARPTVDIDFVTNPSVPHEKHNIKLLPPTRGRDQGAAHQVIVLIHREKRDDADLYWYKDYFWFDSAGQLLSNEAISIFDPDQVEGWKCVDLWDMPGIGINFFPFERGFLYPEEPPYDEAVKDLLTQYGKIEVTILGRDWEGAANGLWIPLDELYSKLEFSVHYASDELLGPNDKIHNITIAPLAPVSYISFLEPNEVLTTLPTNLAMPSSLDGAAFRVTLEPLLFNKAYGLTDIDFTSSDTRFALYKTGPGASLEPIYTAPLVAKAVQDLAIPTGVSTESGSYKVAVTVKAKASGRIDRCEYTNIHLDRRPLDTFGVSKVTTRHTLSGDTVDLITNYTIAPGSRTAELYLSSADVASQTIRFTSDLSALSYGAESHYAAYIKAWNATVSGLEPTSSLYIPESSHKLLYFPGEQDFQTFMLSDASRDDIAAALGSTTASTAAVLPLLPGENLIKYQITLANGHTTGVQTLVVIAGDARPTIEMGLNPHNGAGFTSNNVTASILSLNSTAVAPVGLTLGLLGATPDQAQSLNTNRWLTLAANGAYTFYTYDKYHNIGSHTVAIDYIDKQPPAVSIVNKTLPSSSTFHLEVNVTDNLGADSSRLFLKYDNEYLSLLGLTPDLIIDLPQSPSWQATQVSPNGLFATTCTTTNGAKTFTIQGVFKHDPLNDATTVDRTLILYALDAAGNKSVEHSITIAAANSTAKYVNGGLADGGFSATFNQPILLKTPAEGTPRPVYSLHKHLLPFHSNGVYPLAFTDLFGDYHESTVKVDHYTTLYEHTVSISESAPTKQDVQVFVNVAFNPGLTLELPSSISGATIKTGFDALGNPVGATITMTQNGIITFGLKPRDSAFPTLERKIAVMNIDKAAPNVALSWVYTAPVVDEETSGEVIVSLDSDEDILPLLGTGTTHSFRLDDQEPYTFHYSDLAGNIGSIVATLPVVITKKELQPLDTTPPEYTFTVFSNNTKVSGYIQEGYEALIDKSVAFPAFSGVLQLRFTIDDENQTWLSVSELSPSTPPSAVSISGTTVTVTDNAEFTVVIKDALNNKTEVPIVINSADNTPPTGTITYEKIGPYTVRAYLTMADNRPGQVSLRTTEGVKLETDGIHQGKYYHDFLDNGSFTFSFVDAAGNSGSTIAVVTSLDMSSPVGTITEWNPYYIDADGRAHREHLSDISTNSDVSVYIRFNKPIKSIVPSIVNSYGSLDNISLTHTADTAVVVFKQNAEVSLSFVALNGKAGSTVLLVDIIDKVAPVITTTVTTADLRLTTYIFTANEPVVLEDAESKGVAGTSFSRTFYLNGDYALKFTDRAGNSTTITVSVTGIDRTPPEISIQGLPATKENIAAYNLLHGTSLEHAMTTGPLSITVSINEAGTILFRGITHQVNAAQQITLGIPANGNYELIATDRSGNSTKYQFKVDCLDQTPPQIKFLSDMLIIKQGTTVDEFMAKMLKHIVLTDNFDPAPALVLYEWSVLTADQLNISGTYRVWVSARDQAGNESQAMLYVRVYDQYQPEIWVNGAFTQPNETVFVTGQSSREVNVILANLPTGPGGSEPYTMYYKTGLNTPGQMKNAQLFTTSFIAPRDGFYTIFVVTQSRNNFIIYIYVQS